MKSFKLTSIWMFIFLLAILILSVLIGSKISEGFTVRTSYPSAEKIAAYTNPVYPILTSKLHFDQANGNIAVQTESAISKVITRRGDERTSNTVIKLDAPMATTVESAYTCLSIISPTTSTGDNIYQLFYMPWDKLTFIHLVKTGTYVHTSGFCFDGSKKTIGEYDETGKGKTQTRAYSTLQDIGSTNRFEVNSSFKAKLYNIGAAGIMYDVSSGCIIVPKSNTDFEFFDRDGNEIIDGNKSDLKIITEGTNRDKYDFSIGQLAKTDPTIISKDENKYTLKTEKLFEPWILHIAKTDTATNALELNKAVTDARVLVAAAKKLNDEATTTDATTTATALSAAQADLTAANNNLTNKITKTILVMPYGVKTLIAVFIKQTDGILLSYVARFDESGAIAVPTIPNTDASGNTTDSSGNTILGSTPPSADSAISEYYKWYWYWNKTGTTVTDDYILKTQVVPPVCPVCPSATCGSGLGSGSGLGLGSGLGSGSGGQPISDAVKTVGSVAEKAIDKGSDLFKTAISGSSNVGLAGVDLTKSAVSGTVGIAKDIVGGTTGLARDAAGGTVDLVKDAAKGTLGLVKDTASGAIHLTKDTVKGTVKMARGKYRADDDNSPSYSWAGRNRSYYDDDIDDDHDDYRHESKSRKNGSMDPYTYNGALKKKPSSNFRPVTADFSAFSK